MRRPAKLSQQATPAPAEIGEALTRRSGLTGVHFKCPSDLHKQMRQYALDHDTTMTDLIIEAVDLYMSTH